ncbi:HEXXH motif domain-containing protein [Virgisporangium ochraceum]
MPADDVALLGSRHRVSPDDFESLARGVGDEDVVAALWQSERSWRLTVVRRLLESDTDGIMATGPLPGLDVAWAVLVRADERDPDVTEELLARPEVGIWAAHTLRRVQTAPFSDVPLWVDLGYVHALAAAAAIRTGLTVELDIPVRNGTAVVPTVGAAVAPSDARFGTAPFGTARVHSGTGEITFAGATVRIGAGRPGWSEAVRVDTSADGIDLRVDLADRDVYRDLRGPAVPRPLDTAEVDRWRTVVGEAWAILVRDHEPAARAIAAGLRVLAPVAAKEPFRQLSASGGEAFGGVLLSFPDDATQLAVTLVHEFQHQKLGALLHLLTLTREVPTTRYYAGWRDDPRPASGLLQGAYAFAGVTGFWLVHRTRCEPAQVALAQFEFALWRQQTHLVLRTLLASGQLTGHGERLTGTLLDQVEDYLRQPVPRAEYALATDLALDHAALWRAHNVVVPDAAVADLVSARERGAPAPVPDRSSLAVRAVPDVGLLDARAVLARYRLTRPSTFDLFRADPGTVGRTVTGASAADVAWVAGDRELAYRGYLDQLSAAPDDIHSLVGLGLSRPGRPTDPAARALIGRPELVRAVMARSTPSTPADVVDVARWIGAHLPPADPEPVGWTAV